MASRRVEWREAWRIVASRYPPIVPFERIAPDPAVSEALAALEERTDPEVRDETGAIALVPPGERVAGPGAGFVMAAFAHPNPRGSRFSDGTFGVYYAAAALETAVAETAHHFGSIARDGADPPRSEDMRVLVGPVAADFEDIAALPAAERAAILDPDCYAAGRACGKAIREAGGNGVVYPSVRFAGGECIGAFRPRAVGIPREERHLKFRWNGRSVDRYFDYVRERWIAL